MSELERSFSWRSIAPSVLLPTFLFNVGQGAIIPVIPVLATDVGASTAAAGLAAAMLLVGQLAGSLPSGWVVGKIGERASMIAAAGFTIVGAITCLTATTPASLGCGVLLMGLAASVFALARLAFMTVFVPLVYRARALSVLGGASRLGLLVGPFLGAGFIAASGDVRIVFVTPVVAAILLTLVLFWLPDLKERGMTSGSPEAAESVPLGVLTTMWSRRGVLFRVGAGGMLISAMRASRTTIIPLWAVSLGMRDVDIALLVGTAAGLDFALFYVGGYLMDRFGRLWVGAPAMISFALTHLALSLTVILDAGNAWFIGVTLTMALPNGLTSGIVATMGSDLADRRNPAAFLGPWRLITDSGAAGAPLLISGVTAVASLSAAATTIGALGFVGTILLLRFAPRHLLSSQSAAK